MPKQHDDTTSYTRSDLESLVERVLQEARSQGATQAETGISIESGLNLTVRMGEVETLEYQRDRGMGITVYFGQRKGSASTSDLSSGAIADAVRAAASIARYTAEDDCAGLADAGLMAKDMPDLDLCHPWALEPDAAITLAKRCEAAARDFDPRISNSEGASVSSHRGLRVYANTHG
ncbi:MAG: PmbA/TldA family metallopeptidase, partial [Gammaproteobacteria bacterium]